MTSWRTIYGYQDYGIWDDYADCPWGSDAKHTATRHNDLLYVISNAGNVYRSNAASTAFTKIATNPFGGTINGHVCLSFEGYLYVIGGELASSKTAKVFRSATGVDGSWEVVTADGGFGARDDHAGCVHDGKMFISGGDKTVGGPANDVWSSEDGATFNEVTSSADWAARWGHKMASVGGNLVVLCGGNAAGTASLGDIWSSAAGASWTEITPVLDSTVQAWDVSGGTGNWALVNRSGIGLRDFPAVDVKNGNLFLTGGTEIDTFSFYYSDLLRTQDITNWVHVADTTELPDSDYVLPARTRSVLAWVGDEIFTGGGKGYALKNTGSPANQNEEHFLTSGLVTPDTPDEGSLWEDPNDAQSFRPCTPYGAKRDVADPVVDFERALAIDVRTGAGWPGWGYPFVSTLGNGSPCAGPSQSPRGIFAGDTSGYINEILAEDAPGLGTSAKRVAWPIAAGATTSVIPLAISEDDETGFLQTNMHNGLLAKILHTDGTSEIRPITTNTNSSITLLVALDTAPAEGDVVLITPMACAVLFPERRLSGMGTAQRLRMNIYDNQVIEQAFEFDVFTGDGADPAVDLSAPATTRKFVTGDLRKGAGEIHLQPKSGRAIEEGIRFDAYGGGYLHIEGIEVLEVVPPRDAQENG